MGEKIFKEVKEIVLNNKTRNPFDICESRGIKIKFVSYGTASIINGLDKMILINDKYDLDSKCILCAHELGHAVLHENDICNHYNENNSLEKMQKDKEANLFAAYLLFDDSDLDIKFRNMNSYILQNFIEDHLKLS